MLVAQSSHLKPCWRVTILSYGTYVQATGLHLRWGTPLKTQPSPMSWEPKKFKAGGFGKTYPWIDLVNSEEYDGFGIRSDHLANAGWIKAFLTHWSLGEGLGKDVDLRDLSRVRHLLR